MTKRIRFTIMLFSLLISACGQQGPLFMPLENEPLEENRTTIENNSQEAEAY